LLINQHCCGGAGPEFVEPEAVSCLFGLVSGLNMRKTMNDRSNHFFCFGLVFPNIC
jgi:hypothetical protein